MMGIGRPCGGLGDDSSAEQAAMNSSDLALIANGGLLMSRGFETYASGGSASVGALCLRLSRLIFCS